MLTRWSDLGRTLATLGELQRRMERVHEQAWSGRFWADQPRDEWPPVDLFDAGDELLLRAELPGVPEDAIELTLNQDVLTLAGQRKTLTPEGYRAHRRERSDLSFSRSFTLPCKVDPERVSAETKHGVLTIRLAKAPEAQPRQISVKMG